MPQSRILESMKTSTLGTAAALAAILPVHMLLIVGGTMAALVLLVYTGIALPAVWSANPARRRAAAAALSQILDAWTDTTAEDGTSSRHTARLRNQVRYYRK